uniref:Uncharacterized protein n=1 Tax=Fundulus heteroclitus TaxID=8078 RepID=A0A3Q2SXS5_FUNHE
DTRRPVIAVCHCIISIIHPLPKSNHYLNPSEHLWDKLDCCNLWQNDQHKNTGSLVEEWDPFQKQFLTKLVTSIRRRCQDVVDFDSVIRYCTFKL